MAQTDNVFRLEEEARPAPPPPPQSAAINVLLLALKTLSQRALIAFTKLFTLLTVGAAFWLWLSIPEPNTNQLVWTAMYALFILAANIIVRRR